MQIISKTDQPTSVESPLYLALYAQKERIAVLAECNVALDVELGFRKEDH